MVWSAERRRFQHCQPCCQRLAANDLVFEKSGFKCCLGEFSQISMQLELTFNTAPFVRPDQALMRIANGMQRTVEIDLPDFC
ncbi:hypothetical protein AOX55_00006485 (plasmid) [Sinorhizobium fredii CCBAU 25509]|nr:hypothetical protein AOX55_00006485 [Sinorhizobium fredii CCBAU 25509]